MATITDEFNPVIGDLVADPGLLTVNLETFTATPSTIKPFDECVLAWKVTSATGNVPSVRINAQIVPAEGSMIVRPLSDSKYRLSAKIGPAFVQLAHVDVRVDQSDCEFGGITSVNNILSAAFQAAIDADPELYFATKLEFGKAASLWTPITSVDETGIDLAMKIRAVIPWFPNPKISIDIRFRWATIDEVIEPYFIKQDISVKVPFWAWAIPGAIPGLIIALGFARERARLNVTNGLKQFAAIFLQPPAGRRLVSIQTSPDLLGTINTIHCADPPGIPKVFAEPS